MIQNCYEYRTKDLLLTASSWEDNRDTYKHGNRRKKIRSDRAPLKNEARGKNPTQTKSHRK